MKHFLVKYGWGILAFVVVVLILWFSAIKPISECDGTSVQGLYKWECVQEK
jgi:hypothetical protein